MSWPSPKLPAAQASDTGTPALTPATSALSMRALLGGSPAAEEDAEPDQAPAAAAGASPAGAPLVPEQAAQGPSIFGGQGGSPSPGHGGPRTWAVPAPAAPPTPTRQQHGFLTPSPSSEVGEPCHSVRQPSCCGHTCSARVTGHRVLPMLVAVSSGARTEP